MDGELIITQNFGTEMEGLTKGSKLLSINGKSVENIYQEFLPLIASDGFNETFKFVRIGNINFSLLYRLTHEKTKTFKIEIIEPNSKESKTIIIPGIRFRAFKAKNAKFKGYKFSYNYFKLEQLNDSIAYLCIPSFSSRKNNHEKFNLIRLFTSIISYCSN